MQLNLSNPTHQGTRKICRIVILYRMSEYSGFILANRNTLGQYIFVGCHMMSEDLGVGLLKLHCICIIQNITQKCTCFEFDKDVVFAIKISSDTEKLQHK